MPKFAVEFIINGTLGVVVEATNDSEAKEKAETVVNKMLNESDPNGVIDDYTIRDWIQITDFGGKDNA